MYYTYIKINALFTNTKVLCQIIAVIVAIHHLWTMVVIIHVKFNCKSHNSTSRKWGEGER